MGRLVHPDFLDGKAPVSSSATTAPGYAHTYGGKKPYEVARAMSPGEIPSLLDQFAAGAQNAMDAGFDGVEIHAANGYLLDQFLRDGVNFRADSYGGSIDNRVRLLKEVTQSVADAIGKGRTGVRLSPNGERQGVNDSDPEALFTAASKVLSDIGIAFLEIREPGFEGTFGKAERNPIAPLLRQVFKGTVILNSDYQGSSAQAALAEGRADAISFGRTFLANPDLPFRIQNNLLLNESDTSTWYAGGSAGYTDYPCADENETSA